MRIRRALLVSSLAASMLGGAMVPPASANLGSCIDAYEAAINSLPTPPNPKTIVSVGPPLTINGDVVAAYATAVSTHVADATTTFAICSAQATRDYAQGLADCITATPGVQGVGQLPNRYVTVESLTIKVYHDVIASDVGAVYDCLGIAIA